MSKFAFISRHPLTSGQVKLAASKGIELVPAAAMRLAPYFKIGVFENARRGPVGERPTFQVYDLRTLRL